MTIPAAKDERFSRSPGGVFDLLVWSEKNPTFNPKLRIFMPDVNNKKKKKQQIDDFVLQQPQLKDITPICAVVNKEMLGKLQQVEILSSHSSRRSEINNVNISIWLC